MNDQLGIYNRVLTIVLGERGLASLSENREPRRVLDVVYPIGVKYCLEQGQWKFAMRSSKLTYSPSVTPTFGYRRAYEKPLDCVRISKLCTDDTFNEPVLAYTEEAGWWYSDLDEMFISYVSNHVDFGLDHSRWPESFVNYLCLYLATLGGTRLTQNKTDVDLIEKKAKRARVDALNKDALQGPTVFLPEGNWSRSRRGNHTTRDRGSRSNLIG